MIFNFLEVIFFFFFFRSTSSHKPLSLWIRALQSNKHVCFFFSLARIRGLQEVIFRLFLIISFFLNPQAYETLGGGAGNINESWYENLGSGRADFFRYLV